MNTRMTVPGVPPLWTAATAAPWCVCWGSFHTPWGTPDGSWESASRNGRPKNTLTTAIRM